MVNSTILDIETSDGHEVEVTIIGCWKSPNGYGLKNADYYEIWYDETNPAGILTFDDAIEQESYTYVGPLTEYELFQITDLLRNYDDNDDWIE